MFVQLDVPRQLHSSRTASTAGKANIPRNNVSQAVSPTNLEVIMQLTVSAAVGSDAAPSLKSWLSRQESFPISVTGSHWLERRPSHRTAMEATMGMFSPTARMLSGIAHVYCSKRSVRRPMGR
jgi:hypothetical protein